MKISNNTNVLTEAFGEEKAIEMLIAAGFDAIDLSCFEMLDDNNCPKLSKDYKAYAKKLKSKLEGTNVYFNQAHAPFPISRTDDTFTKEMYQNILRCMEFCSLLGVRNLIVHPMTHLDCLDEGNRERHMASRFEYFKTNK